MNRIPETDYREYIPWAEMNTANRVYPLSIAEGIQPEEIYEEEGAVFFWHYCGFGYISGKPSAHFLNEILEEMKPSVDRRRLVLITHDEDVISFFRQRDVQISSRFEYSYSSDKRQHIAMNQDRFTIAVIDQKNISLIKGRIIPSFSWDSPQRFLEKGFGYAALENETVCAAAFSSAVSSDEVDIGVETLPEYRNNGLASALADRMCRHIAASGKKPVWAHGAANAGSMNTALKCGFVMDRINAMIRRT